MRKLLIVIVVFSLFSSFMSFGYVNAKDTKTILFLCEKEEYSSSKEFLKWVQAKKKFGDVSVLVDKNLFNAFKLKRFLADQDFYLTYVIGSLNFFETLVSKDDGFPVDFVSWDAPLWWSREKFSNMIDDELPTSKPNIVARIPVNSVEDLEKFLSLGESELDPNGALFVSTNVLNTQKSKLFPHYEHKGVNTYDFVSTVAAKSNLKPRFLAEKRGDYPLSKKVEQLERDLFVDSLITSEIVLLSSTAEIISEGYFEEKDSLIPIPETRRELATSYVSSGKIVIEDFFAPTDAEKIKNKNRLIISQNFYSEVADLGALLSSSRCLVTTYPKTLFFNVSQKDLAEVHAAILEKFLKGGVLADAITNSIFELNKNYSRCDLVVWGDPLITSTFDRDEVKEMDISLKRNFNYIHDGDIIFVNLPEFVSYTKRENEHIFQCSLPVVVFFNYSRDAIIENYFFLEFQGEKEKGWVLVKYKILNFWGIEKSPFFYCI